MALSEYDKKYLNAEQQAAVQAATDYGYQTGDWSTAHTMAEAIRSQKNYSGGENGNDYIQTNQALAPAASGYDLSALLKEQQKAQTDAALSGLEAAYKKALSSYDATAERLPQSYHAARNAAAAQDALARRSFDERAIAAGLGSGARAQAELAYGSVYQGELAALDQAQANAAADLEQKKADLQSEYASAIAQAKADSNAALSNALYNELVRVQSLQRQDAQNAQSIALDYGLTGPAGLSVIRSLDDLAQLDAGQTGQLTAAQIKEMQRYYGTTADGIWGPKSYAAAGGRDAAAAWRSYVNGGA